MSADDAITSALAALSAALDELGAPAMIIGGIALIARGVPRHTVDIDATIWADRLDVDRALEVLNTHGIVARIPDARAFALERQILLVRHAPSETPLDISLAWLPFEHEALDRATIVSFSGTRIRVAQAEDLVVYKAIAWRDRDRADIERLLARHGDTIDLTRVRKLVAQFADALEIPERLAEFDAIVQRAIDRRAD